MHACLMLNPSSKPFQVSNAINYFPPRPPGLPALYKVVQKGSSKVGELYLSFHCHLD